MKANPKAITVALIAAIAAVSSPTTEARGYEYSRRPSEVVAHHRSRRDPFDMVSEIFTMPVYDTMMNSLMRRHREEMARFDRFFEGAAAAPSAGTVAARAAPRYEVLENEESVHLTMEVPGVLAKDLNVEVSENDRVLRISGKRKRVHGGELYETEFDQSFQIQPDVDVDRIKVELSAGILHIEAPKKPKTVKKIPVLTGSDLGDDSGESPIVLEAKKALAGEQVAEVEEADAEDVAPTEEVDGLTISEE